MNNGINSAATSAGLSNEPRMFESQERTVNEQKKDSEKRNTKKCYDPNKKNSKII